MSEKNTTSFLTSDFAESTKLFLLNKIKDPRPFYFVSAWLLINWQFVYFLVRTSAEPLSAISIAKTESLGGFLNLFLFPVLIYLVLLMAVPILIALGKFFYNRVNLPVSAFLLRKLEPRSYVKRDELTKLQQEHQILLEEYTTQSSILEKEEKIDALEKQIESFKSVIQDLRGQSLSTVNDIFDQLKKLDELDESTEVSAQLMIHLHSLATQGKTVFSLKELPVNGDYSMKNIFHIVTKLVDQGYLKGSRKGVLSSRSVARTWDHYEITSEGLNFLGIEA